ncbi:hypothetical protein CPLU01_10556 [Colletotrichum plurivorum]|uniref:Heterokaryon incompatibility domain-containing protein n=1 Tax=Colletotrichum plurivorum TaxID=2175906 RepID=A0A8H6NA20_9PEZI|nr:hypothetical protein CPLU01_10556 [Colletotrichum plurivorum]
MSANTSALSDMSCTITDSARDATVPVPQRAVTLLRIRQARDGNDHYYVDITFCPKTSSFEPESEVQGWDALFSLQICQGLQTSETTLPDNTKSDSSLTLAKSWVTECSMDHKQPIHDTEHCWGFKECTSLDTNNYAEMLRGHPLESLPQLYQDAAYVTRQLGVRYLWIDSLCIIQKLVDWQRESAQMHNIYLNSFCNISAAHATDAHNGRNAAYSISDAYFWKTKVSEALINTRAWEMDTVDIFPRGVLSASWKLKNAREQESLDSGTPKNTYGRLLWKEMVEAYTASDLTFPEDKLIALSAVAKRMSSILADQYVAGMWLGQLEVELLWSIVERRPATTSSRGYRAPSWSWASVDSRVMPGFPCEDSERLLIRVQDFHPDYATDDTTGLITGGWLRIWGRLMPLGVSRQARSERDHCVGWEVSINGVPVRSSAESIHLDVVHEGLEECTLFCMPARIRNSGKNIVDVLLLELVDQERGVFRRIGLGSFASKEQDYEALWLGLEVQRIPCEEHGDVA